MIDKLNVKGIKFVCLSFMLAGFLCSSAIAEVIVDFENALSNSIYDTDNQLIGSLNGKYLITPDAHSGKKAIQLFGGGKEVV